MPEPLTNPAEAPAPLHVLHVGSGFRPLRWGGLVAYVEDLAAEQVRRGHRVSYFFSGRYFRWPKGPLLKRWRREGVDMHEVVNSPLYDHGRQPELELAEPEIEQRFEATLAELRPDVVHVHELAGLPSSLLGVARGGGVPVVMTLQDYFPLCSNFKLLDAEGNVCLRREMGAECAASVRADQRPPNVLFEGTMRTELRRVLPDPLLRTSRGENLVERVCRSRLAQPPRRAHAAPSPPEAYQRRRDVNIDRLNHVDRLIAMSTRVAEIYAELGVDEGGLMTMPLTLAHIDALSPRLPSTDHPVTFGTLGGAESAAKGSRLLLQAIRLLAAEAEPGTCRVLIFGQCERELATALTGIPGVELRGTYRPEQLNRLLDEVDVGLMPSVWEEAYGYAGIEFIAKGIPVLANRIGGMTDYVREGETGWLNSRNSGRGLAEAMLALSREPQRVASVSETTRSARDELVVAMPDHADAMDEVYRAAM